MLIKDEIQKNAVEALKIESESIFALTKFINNDFVNSVRIITESKGRVVVTGIGKSANIAQKIVATLNSTGTPSLFMHAADAIHGDLGNIQTNDIVICISKSGDTPEIKVLLPLIKGFGNKLIAITGNPNSMLGKKADYILNTFVEKEACPNNLAPTSSTTAQLAMGDALAVCLLKSKGFTSNDFAKYHPGGALGKKLFLKVDDIYINNEKPTVNLSTPIMDVILEISSKRLGAAVVTENEKVLGMITDGDLRRMLQNTSDIKSLIAKDIMSKNPKTIDTSELAVSALSLMQERNITQLVVVSNDKYAGIIHLHDLLNEGLS